MDRMIATQIIATKQWRRKLVDLRGAGNKILVQGGRFNVNIFIAYIVDNAGTILAVLHLW